MTIPTYSLTPSVTTINEGQTLTTAVRTTGVAAGTTLYWALSGTGINASDFSAGALTGTGTVAANGTLSFSHTLRNDLTTEGNESLAIRLFSNSARTQQVGSTATVSVVDTSRDPITGQRLRFNDIGTVTSDTVYSGVNDIIRGLMNVVVPGGYTDSDLSALSYIGAEFEYNNNFIVITLQGRGDNGPNPTPYPTEDRRTSAIRGSGDWVSRGVIQGTFTYGPDGNIGTTNIQAVASSIVLITQNGRSGHTARSSNSSGTNLARLSSLADVWSRSNPSQLADGSYFVQNMMTPYGRDTYSSDPTAVQQLAQFGGGRFFYSGWETNPFNSNLI